MKLMRILRSVILLAMCVMLLTGFTVASQGYERYQEAVGATSLEDKVDSIRAKEGYTKLEELPQVYLGEFLQLGVPFFRPDGIHFILKACGPHRFLVSLIALAGHGETGQQHHTHGK